MGYKELFAEKSKDGTARLLSSDYVKFDKKGIQIIGRLLSINEVTGQLGGKSYNQYLFDSDEGLVKCAFGTATDNEAGALMRIGGVYSVVYEGQEKLKGGRSINRFAITELESPGEGQVGGHGDIPY